MTYGYYKEKIKAIRQIKSLILNSESITVDAVKDYVRNTYGFGAKIVHDTVDELVRAGVVQVSYGVISKPDPDDVDDGKPAADPRLMHDGENE